MLTSLKVKDYALIKNIFVEFGEGLNIITGETGAGKSILIDAISLLLGERASTETVRQGAERAVIEGIFDVHSNKKIRKILEENEIECLSDLILRREISVKGSNRCFVNDSPAQLSVVKELGDILVDLHGQHEHQSLLKNETHIEYLDQFAGSEDLLRNYKWLYSASLKLKNEIEEIREKNSSTIEKRDTYNFQLKEIDSVSPELGEEEKLNEELIILENSEKLLNLSTEAYDVLFESESTIYDSLVKVQNKINELEKIDKAFIETSNECETALTLIKDISEFIRSYKSKIEMDPERLEKIRERLGAISLLKKKYGGSIESILEHKKKIKTELNLIENSSGNLDDLEDKLQKVQQNCAVAAKKLSEKRKASIKKVEEEIRVILSYVGITNAEFKVKINNELAENNEDSLNVNGKKYKYNSNGYDFVEFFISTNLGEEPKPLSKIASGGEISRVMLALKTILARNKFPLLIFDEIDTGISGQIAQKVGQAIKSLSENHQIIAITHLPQIAGLADHHYVVEKETVDERVVSTIRKLEDEKRVVEVAKLMSGENVTEASIKGAKELMGS